MDKQLLLKETTEACDAFRKAVEDLDAGVGARVVIDKLERDLIEPLRKKYPYYTVWIDGFLSWTIRGRPLSKDDPLYKPVSNSTAFAAYDDKATRDQMLKVMLLKGTREQKFSAAKTIGMVYRDLPETDENFALLEQVIQELAEIFG